MTPTVPKDGRVLRQRGEFRSGAVLGGISTGGVELWPDGRFHHWAVANGMPWAASDYRRSLHAAPELQLPLGATEFIVRVKAAGERPRYRWLFSGSGDMLGTTSHFWRVHKYFLIKAFPEIAYEVDYPFVTLRYLDDEFPLDMKLRAWSPIIPHDVKMSATPGFFLDFTWRNLAETPVEVSLLWQMQNFAGYASPQNQQRHERSTEGRTTYLTMRGGLLIPEDDTSGDITVWAEGLGAQEVTCVSSNPFLQNLFWSFHREGHLLGPLEPSRITREEFNEAPVVPAPNKGWLCIKQLLEPEREAEARLGMSWHFPNHYSVNRVALGKMYANWYADSLAAAQELQGSREILLERARLLPETLRNSSLPEPLATSMLDQLTTLVKNSHFAADGRFGIQRGHGVEAFNAVDIEHYGSYALALLYPELRRTALDTVAELTHPVNGKIAQGLLWSVEKRAAGGDALQGYSRWDVSAEFTLQAYRDCRWYGDRDLLRRTYPIARRAMRLLAGMDFYGVQLPYTQGGLTYDHWNLHGVVTYMAGLYLAALRALEQMAQLMGDTDTVTWARDRFAKGRESFESLLWRDNQYVLFYGRRTYSWNESEDARGEHRYLNPVAPSSEVQAGSSGYRELWETAVMTDALNGNAASALAGLSDFLDKRRVQAFLRLVLKRNYQPENWALVNGTHEGEWFPDEWPFMQWHTPWSGVEYFFASQCYIAGLVEEGDALVAAILKRHEREGMRWDHAEAGNHSARALAVWSCYLARLGFDYDGFAGRLTVLPRGDESYQGLLVLPHGLARLALDVSLEGTEATLTMLSGYLSLRELVLPTQDTPRAVNVRGHDAKVSAQWERQENRLHIRLAEHLEVAAGDVWVFEAD